ncbi:hypothetical protein Q5P01_014875 [Channa striata]|uniref:Uncharacterized protein n=1 Tax=Channa striata TaxID=64152 RepID=A0AA88MJ34_CHASR|nr:hypothetical protein Q5P01_014875 [Channa striata]
MEQRVFPRLLRRREELPAVQTGLINCGPFSGVKTYFIRREESELPLFLLQSVSGWCHLSPALRRSYYCYENVKKTGNRNRLNTGAESRRLDRIRVNRSQSAGISVATFNGLLSCSTVVHSQANPEHGAVEQTPSRPWELTNAKGLKMNEAQLP